MSYPQEPDLSLLCMPPDGSINQAIALIDQNQQGIVLVVDPQQHLIGTITDGDIRRAILVGKSLEMPIRDLLAGKTSDPVTADLGTDSSKILRLMQDYRIRQVPLLDQDGKVAGLATIDTLLPGSRQPLQAVIMAGGFGTRLRPLTEEIPKPMLPVGDRPILQRILEQMRDSGIEQVSVTTHYLPEKITDYFGTGERLGLKLNYVHEDEPLGTAGALGLINPPEHPLLIINGDILTQLDFRAMLNFHQEHQALMTVAVRQYTIKVPYGVIETDGVLVHQLTEKPTLSFFVNAGIYLIEPIVQQYIPSKTRFDMTDLIQRLIDAGKPVVSFPVREYWIDIGQHADYQQVQEDIKKQQS